MLTDEIKKLFQPTKEGTILVITVGNRARRDDGIGPYIADHIRSAKNNIIILNAEDKPENIIDKIDGIRPFRTIVIDSADFGGSPGEARLLEEDMVSVHSISTHRFPIKIVTELIKKDTNSEIFFIGIQPQDAGLGEVISPRLKHTADSIIQCMKSI